jgi:hypothetical protein
MATVKLYDERDPIKVGQEVFAALKNGEDREILTDREGLAQAFYEACQELGSAWEDLTGPVREALVGLHDDVAGHRAITAREEMVQAMDVAYTLMSVIWEASSSIRGAEEMLEKNPTWGMAKAYSDDDEEDDA